MRFTEKILLKVMEENADVEENIVVRTSWTRKCSNPACGKCFTTLKRKCDLCFSKVLTSEKEIVRLSSNKQVTCREYTFDSDVIPNQVSLKMGEPSMVNPNSYTTVETVLADLKIQHINEERKWAILGWDGPPYNLASRIIESNKE